jgi:hypothetical protein
MARRFLSTARRLQRLESSAISAHHTAEHDLQRRQGEWHTRFLHTWHEAIVQTYADRTGDSPPKSTVGEG